MSSALIPMGILFFTGLIFGSTVCNLTCGPLILVRLGDRGRGWRDGMALATLYSIPRVLALSAFGAVVGGGTGIVAGSIEGRIVTLVQAFTYLFIGALLILNGIRFSRERSSCRSGPFERLLSRFAPRMPGSERRYMVFLGLLFSLVCIGEAWGFLGLASVKAGLDTSGVLAAIGLGASYMLAFGIGLSIPPIAMASIASEIGRRYDLNQMVKAGGYLMILVGAGIVLFEIFALANVLT